MNRMLDGGIFKGLYRRTGRTLGAAVRQWLHCSSWTPLVPQVDVFAFGCPIIAYILKFRSV